MIIFVWNLLLAVAWALAVGDFTLTQLAIGFLLGYAILWFTQGIFGATKYFAKVAQAARFFAYYLAELVKANLRVAYDVVTPTHKMHPGVIAVPLDAKTDIEIAMFANLITLTPGTLGLFLSPDRKVLYVHVMYLDKDAVTTRRRLKEDLEQRVLELLR